MVLGAVIPSKPIACHFLNYFNSFHLDLSFSYCYIQFSDLKKAQILTKMNIATFLQ